MTKLEEKLIELGYEETGDGYSSKRNDNFISYSKLFHTSNLMAYLICVDVYSNGYFHSYLLEERYYIRTQQDIDNLQQAFNQMQKDLEELREYESK